MKFSIKDFFSKCDQIRRKLGIWSYLLKKPLTENFIFRAVEAFYRSKIHSQRRTADKLSCLLFKFIYTSDYLLSGRLKFFKKS